MIGIEELVKMCKNEVRLIGTITEFNMDCYHDEEKITINYKGVVNCCNSFITIKSWINSYDLTFYEFVENFKSNVVGEKVFVIGKLNSNNGVTVSYISKTGFEDRFNGFVEGVPFEAGKLLIFRDGCHQVVNTNSNIVDTDNLYVGNVVINPMNIDGDVIISDEPPIKIDNISKLIEVDGLDSLTKQALEEREIYIEAFRQGRDYEYSKKAE